MWSSGLRFAISAVAATLTGVAVLLLGLTYAGMAPTFYGLLPFALVAGAMACVFAAAVDFSRTCDGEHLASSTLIPARAALAIGLLLLAAGYLFAPPPSEGGVPDRVDGEFYLSNHGRLTAVSETLWNEAVAYDLRRMLGVSILMSGIAVLVTTAPSHPRVASSG